MLAEAILVHGVIGYKFCWLLPEDQNQGTPAGHESAKTPIGNESLKVVVDMKSPSCELKALDAMNKSWFSMTWTTLGHEFKPLNLWTTQVYGWYAWFRIMCLSLYMQWKTKSCWWHERLSINSLRLWMLWTVKGCGWHEQLKVLRLGL